jgi:NitT/TauT family transport system substrate-binding protein
VLTPITIATVPTEVNALFYVAEAQNFFASNGLQVTFKENYDSGAAATSAMLNGEADIASATEFLMARQILNQNELIGFGTIARYENTFILWHADDGIETLGDLKGKKIGVPLQTIAEFYLGRTLDLNGMSIQQVSLVEVKPAESEQALVEGQVDALVAWEPWVTQIDQHLGQEVIISPLQSRQHAYWNLVSTADWTHQHSDAISRLMKSLTQAEEYVANHPDETKAMVRKRMNLDLAYMETVWPRYQISLSLDQSLILAMEDEARWMISNSLTTEKQVPDFLNYIYADGLEAVKPEAVNIIR